MNTKIKEFPNLLQVAILNSNFSMVNSLLTHLRRRNINMVFVNLKGERETTLDWLDTVISDIKNPNSSWKSSLIEIRQELVKRYSAMKFSQLRQLAK